MVLFLRTPQSPEDRETDKMQKAVRLVSLLVLGWAWTLQGVPVLPEPLYETQENFDLEQFLGTWYYVGMATTYAHVHHKEGVATGKLVLESSTTEGKIKMIRTGFRHGTCKEISGEYELTATPGRFLYHAANWGVDVDAYVAHTNYNEYAIVIMIRKQSSGNSSTSVKLYSRTTDVRATLIEDFKTLAKQLGMSDDSIIVTQNKGDCVPGEQMAEPQTEPEVQQTLTRKRRDLVLPTLAADTEGSGDQPMFSPEDCKAAPDVGPCFGFVQRYYYNSTSMTCDLFDYGGCLGNQNNFVMERDCLQSCRTEAVCRLPMTAKPCTGQPPLWAFDSNTGLCAPYKTGFCQTNGNKFYTKAECEEYCGVVKDDEELLKLN